jgi:hypothetical protein
MYMRARRGRRPGMGLGASGGGGAPGSQPRLLWRLGLHAERVHAGLDLVVQQPVQHLVPLHEALARKLLRHDRHPAWARGVGWGGSGRRRASEGDEAGGRQRAAQGGRRPTAAAPAARGRGAPPLPAAAARSRRPPRPPGRTAPPPPPPHLKCVSALASPEGLPAWPACLCDSSTIVSFMGFSADSIFLRGVRGGVRRAGRGMGGQRGRARLRAAAASPAAPAAGTRGRGGRPGACAVCGHAARPRRGRGAARAAAPLRRCAAAPLRRCAAAPLHPRRAAPRSRARLRPSRASPLHASRDWAHGRLLAGRGHDGAREHGERLARPRS